MTDPTRRPSRAFRRARLLAALGCVCAALPASAETAGDPVAQAEAAAQLCQAGRADEAAVALEALQQNLAAEYGARHSAPLIVQLGRAHVARARGRDAEAVALESLPSEEKGRKTPSKLKRALRGLRVCAGIRPVDTKPVDLTFDEHLRGARRSFNQGRYDRALEAAGRARRSLGSDAKPPERMRLHETLALIHLARGDLSRSVVEAERAEALARQLGAVRERITLARLMVQAGHFERATVALEELDAKVSEGVLRAELEEARGELALRLGAPDRAMVHLDRALAGHRKHYGDDGLATAAVHHLRGDTARLAGDFPAASSAYRAAVRVRTRAGKSGADDAARTHNAIGVLQADLGDWTAADASFQAAQSAMTRTLGANHPETLTVRINRAWAAWHSSRSDEAASEFAATAAALEGALGGEHPSVALALRNQARIESDRGRLTESAKLLKRALATQQAALGESHPALAPTRLDRGRLLGRQGSFDDAAQEVDAALQSLIEAYGPEHPAVARARTARARVALAQGESATATAHATQASHDFAAYTRRTFGAISDRQRALLSSDSHDVLGTLFSIPEADDRALFVAMLPHRDSVLRSIAARRTAGSKRGNSANARKLDALRARYLAAVLGAGPRAGARARELARSIDELEAASAAESGNARELAPELVFERACKALPEDTALVKFVAYDRTVAGARESTPAYGAFVVHGGACRVERIDLGAAGPLEAAAESFATAMREGQSDDLAAREKLGRLLLAPLRDSLRGTHRWLVVPDGVLWGVPMAALPDPEAKDRFLLERVTVGYLTSTYELAEAGPASPTATPLEGALLVGAPDFGPVAELGPVVLTSTGPCHLAPFEALPGTEREIGKISELLDDANTLTGDAATKPRLSQALDQKPSLVHFATHAYFAGEAGCGAAEDSDGTSYDRQSRPVAPNPLLLSGIVMAGANESQRVDAGGRGGILTAYEVAGLDLSSAGLVVLSACDTGTGLTLRGQEVQGLRWGFRAAGARALVTSLWRSNDEATSRMMDAFYQTLLSDELANDPMRGPEALRSAQLAQLKRDRRIRANRPNIWANFIFSGVL